MPHSVLYGIQALERVDQIGRALLRLHSRKLDDSQCFGQPLQVVVPRESLQPRLAPFRDIESPLACSLKQRTWLADGVDQTQLETSLR